MKWNFTISGFGRRRGQSLILAVIVMFVLFFVGAIFVALVARNLQNSGRAKDTLSALELAQAGVKHGSYFLQYSALGADWRPAPTQVINPNDPDQRWLNAGYSRIEYGNNGRFLLRVSYAPGFITDPKNPLKRILNPNGKYIKIEAVGRPGFLDQNDPTSFLNTPAPRLRREIVAYKAIGLTDYGRWVTNWSNDSKFMAVLGVPPIGVPTGTPGTNTLSMQWGDMPVRTPSSGGATEVQRLQRPGYPIRVNGDLAPLGDTMLVEDPDNGELALLSGKVKFDPNVNPGARLTLTNRSAGTTVSLLDSGDPKFDSAGGVFRDGVGIPDLKGFARAISRQDPPSLNELDPATNTTRTRLNTRESGRWMGSGASSFNTGRFGFGEGLYIDNFGSFERQTQSVQGGQSFRSLWTKPSLAPPWNGPFYIPPGCFIEFGYPIAQLRDASGNLLSGQFGPVPGFRIDRDDPRGFRDPNGNIAPKILDFTLFIYKASGARPVLKLSNEFFRSYLVSTGMTETQVDEFTPPFNGYIFAEGNIRLRGLLASKTNIPIRKAAGDPDNLSDQQIRDACETPSYTVSSAVNIYVEGSLVRETYAIDGIPGSSIALLAQENVVINPTMFMSPNKGGIQWNSTGNNETAPFHADITTSEASSTPPFALGFMFGDDPGGYTTTQSTPISINLLIRHAAPREQTWLNLFINKPLATGALSPLYNFNIASLPPVIYPLGSTSYPVPNPDTANRPPLEQLWPVFEQREFTLLPRPAGANYPLVTQPGLLNQIQPSVDLSFIQGAPVQDYLLSQAAIAPMDVRIEAVMYAQQGSFFVIPGYPMNPDPSDTRDAALRRAQEANLGYPAGTMLRPPNTSDYYPFYGEPYDCRITVVGAISENRTASVSDQVAWMQLWGYINEVQGSTGFYPNAPAPAAEIRVPDQHILVGEVGMPLPATDPRTANEKNARITRGLRFLYDPFLHAPFAGYNPDNTGTILKGAGGWVHYMNGATRQDDFGRTLPPIPRLPVCPGFVFYGEV